MRRGIGCIVLVLGSWCGGSAFAVVRYVDPSASGLNNGTTWSNAYTQLPSALSAAAAGDEIRVAQGIYRPAPSGGNRTLSFTITKAILLQGGYVGVAGRNPDLRDPMLYPSVLSGDLNGNDGPGFANNAENSYHVVKAVNLTVAATIDGFDIVAGNANGFADLGAGGGVYMTSSKLTLKACRLTGNFASHLGGAAAGDNGCQVSGVDCLFSANKAVDQGGAVFLQGAPSKVTMANCGFANNSGGSGGAVACMQAGLSLTSCEFSGNIADAGASPGGGGAVFVNSGGTPLTVASCEFSGNSSLSEGGGLSANAIVSSIITDCSFVQNSAGLAGGLYLGGGSSGHKPPRSPDASSSRTPLRWPEACRSPSSA